MGGGGGGGDAAIWGCWLDIGDVVVLYVEVQDC
jgi:hypothetical protein